MEVYLGEQAQLLAAHLTLLVERWNSGEKTAS